MAIVSWEYYNSLYNKIDEDNFEKAEALAEKEVKKVIGAIRWNDITENTFGYEELKDCICKVMDMMQDNLKAEEHKGVSSVSNDGYSVSYGQVSTTISLNEELTATIKQCLSGTGLVGAY